MATWPPVARAQQARMPVIGFLSSLSVLVTSKRISSFGQGLSETGYIVGRDVTVEARMAEGQYDRLPALAADLVAAVEDRVGTIIKDVSRTISFGVGRTNEEQVDHESLRRCRSLGCIGHGIISPEGGGAASALAVLRLRIILRRQVDRLHPLQNVLSHSNCPLENITVGHDVPARGALCQVPARCWQRRVGALNYVLDRA
jgi:hypothetical protein